MTTGGIDLRYVLDRGAFKLDVELVIPASGITGVYGRSGSGKTSLLRCIAGLEAAAQGFLRVGDTVWDDAGASVSVPPQARGVGYVFQEPRLFPHLSVRGNLDYALKRRNGNEAPIDESAVIELLGIGHLLQRSTADLSGGEAQRVSIARALLRAPALLLMDEPLSSLDRARRDEVLDVCLEAAPVIALQQLFLNGSCARMATGLKVGMKVVHEKLEKLR